MNSKKKEGASSSGGQPGASGAPSGSGKDEPRTRLQKRKRMESDNFKKRKVPDGKTLFRSRKIIGRNDVLVDTSCGKVKVEVPEEEDVKPEVKVFTEEVDIVEGPSGLGEISGTGLGGVEGGEIVVKVEPMDKEDGVNSSVNEESEMNLTICGTRSLSVGLCEEGKRQVELEKENRSLREIVADQALEIQSLRWKLEVAEAALVAERGFRASDEVLVDNGNLEVEVAEISDSDLQMPVENNFGTEFGKVAPFLLDYLDLTQVLDCRLVSHKWKNAVESWLEAHLLKFVTGKTTTMTDLETDDVENEYYYDSDEEGNEEKSEEGEKESEEDDLSDEEDRKNKQRVVSHQSHVLPLAVQQLQAKYTFSEKQDLVKFQEYAVNVKGNPFIGRCATFKVTKETLQMEESLEGRNVTVGIWHYDDSLQFHKNYDNYENVESELKDCALDFWQEIGSILSLYGEHLWHLTLIQDECGLTPEGMYDVLKIVLRHLRNLKTLSFDVNFMKMLAYDHPWNCHPLYTTPIPCRRGCKPSQITARKSTGGIGPRPPCKCNAGSVNRLLKYRVNELLESKKFSKRLVLLNLEAVKIRVRDAYFKEPGYQMEGRLDQFEHHYYRCLCRKKLWNFYLNLKCVVLDYSIQEEKFDPEGAEVESSAYQKTSVLTCARIKKERVDGKVKIVAL